VIEKYILKWGHDMLQESIKKLVAYGIKTGLTPECERVYTTNLLLDLFGQDEFVDPEIDEKDLNLDSILADLLDEAVKLNLCEDSIVYKDLFDTKIMNCLMPRPSQVQERFNALYKESPEEATKYFYNLSCNSNYIRTTRVAKNKCWKTETPYGTLDITINLSKPEKDPKAIAAALKAKNSAYPKCQLCMENEGYAGRVDHPARENHRIIPITINDSKWGFQYSPYVYFNEHCIVFNGQHVPMKIEKATFKKLFDFVQLFPHYFLGSNADLPIVGGSILTHDHFQGGHYTFAMETAEVEKEFTVTGFEDVKCGIVNWPLSVIRLDGENPDRIIELADHILKAWRGYSDEDAFIFAETDGTPHNTITPIARRRGDLYEMDLTLRNNITTDERPLGVFHPKDKLHHIKKENIGLIEVMGLAVLPARLATEMEELKPFVVARDLDGIRANETLSKHADWVEEFLPKYDSIDDSNVDQILKDEIGAVFCEVLEDAGVFKTTEEGREAFDRFIATL
jgi:UDPglucose--hexose-1-phosphate uridylyltransferase